MTLDDIPEMVPLKAVAARFGTTCAVLLDASREGRFPGVVRLSRRCAFVRVSELNAWLSERAENPDSVRERERFIDEASRPALIGTPRQTVRRVPLRRCAQ
ncbi:MAG: helix-turn-helix transcriptional regulator [Planctomycetota bacterium]